MLTQLQQQAVAVFGVYDVPVSKFWLSAYATDYITDYPHNELANILSQEWNNMMPEPLFSKLLLHDSQRGLGHNLNLIAATIPINTWQLNPDYIPLTPKPGRNQHHTWLSQTSKDYLRKLATIFNLSYTYGRPQKIHAGYINATIEAIGTQYIIRPH